MVLMVILKRLLILFALAGVVIAPVSLAVANTAMASASIEMATMTGMPAGMPCCPDKAPAKTDCTKSCPLALVCAAGMVLHGNRSMSWLPVIAWHELDYGQFHQGRLISSLIEPPARPPKV